MNNDLRAGSWHGLWVLGERFVLLQLTLCKNSLSTSQREYIHRYVIILLFLTTDTRFSPPRKTILWKTLWKVFLGRQRLESCFYMYQYIYSPCAVQINFAGIYERDRSTSRINTYNTPWTWLSIKRTRHMVVRGVTKRHNVLSYYRNRPFYYSNVRFFKPNVWNVVRSVYMI